MPSKTGMTDDGYKEPLLVQLVDRRILDQQQVQELYEEQERTGKQVRQVLIDLGLATENDLLAVIADQLGTDVVELSGEIPSDVVRSIPASVARIYNLIPVATEPQLVTFVTSELLGPEVVDELRFVLNRDVQFMVASQKEISDYIVRYYGDASESVSDMLSALEIDLEAEIDADYAADADQINLEEAASKTPIIRFVNLILYQAIQDRASDIHFEPFENEFKIRYRVDGALYELAPPPKHMALPVTTRIKVLSGLNIAERRLPQDGRIQLNVAGRFVDLRVSTLPTQFGESVVLRVLDRSVVSLDLENLGMPDDVFDRFGLDIEKPNGIIVVTGPTGSGKTTTLYSALRRINRMETKLLTAEEPVEYDIDGILQVPINESIGNSFAKVLRAFLRQDPDVIMVGEIRDLETAEIAIQASLTGHLVFSTLHTNDSAGAITRLIDMNVEPFLIASTMEAIMAQRLVRTICQHCRESYMPEPRLLDQLDLSEVDVDGRPFFHGIGCQHCNGTGYHGRRGVYEYLIISDVIRDMITEMKPTSSIRQKAMEQGMRTLREDGVRCILDGSTTVEEVLRYT